jgi:DNA-binding MarR family transcriptional regulator
MHNDYRLILALAERIHRWSQGRLRHELARMKIHDIGPGHATVLLDIGDESMPVTELARRGAYHPPNLSSHLTELREAGYIRCDRLAQDRRVRIVSLTEKGRRLLDALTELHDIDAADLVQLVRAEALASCAQALQQLERDIRSKEDQGSCLSQDKNGRARPAVGHLTFARQIGPPPRDRGDNVDPASSPGAATADDQGRGNREALIRAFMALPPEQREALLLTRVEDLSYGEAALVCGVAVGTIKSRIARGRDRLSALLPHAGQVVP